MNVAIIPARGGSKRIPRKNVRAFAGRPLIAYSIMAAAQSALFDQIVVSTDDPEIAAIARQYGAVTPFVRPAELANDHATTVPVIKHAVSWVREHWAAPQNVCCIYATAPFIQVDALRAAHAMLTRESVTGYVFSATTFPFPIQRAFRVKPDGRVEMFEPAHYNTRSQDLEEAYQDAGQFYWGSAAAYMSEKIFFAPDSMAYLLPRHLVQDIDTPEDWKRAELMYAALKASGDLA
ncbi:MAG: pseudaminic acid cytidylyltransferase [Pseudomonadota bacterium]|nr:pseudaminic acid cytidylyltransferase [Pseudomonadota bacterium]